MNFKKWKLMVLLKMLINGLYFYPFGNIVIYKLKCNFPELKDYINIRNTNDN